MVDIMKRLGKFTGKIYEENEVKNMGECGVCITLKIKLNVLIVEDVHSIIILNYYRFKIDLKNGGCYVRKENQILGNVFCTRLY